MKHLIITAYILFFCAGICPAAQIVVVKSADYPHYNLALQGIQEISLEEVEVIDATELNPESISRKIRRLGPDIVVAMGPLALSGVGEINGDTAVVYCMVNNPHPYNARKNITGVSMEIPPSAQLDAFLKSLPHLKKIGLVYNRDRSGQFAKLAETACMNRGLTLVPREVISPRETIPAITELRGRIDAFWMIPDAVVYYPEMARHLLLFSFNNRIPVLTFSPKYRKSGAIVSLEIDPLEMGRQAGKMVNAILTGRNVEDVPPQTASFSVNLNRKVAGKMRIPLSITNVAENTGTE